MKKQRLFKSVGMVLLAMIVSLSFFQYAGALEPDQSEYFAATEEQSYLSAQHVKAIERIQAKDASMDLKRMISSYDIALKPETMIELLPAEKDAKQSDQSKLSVALCITSAENNVVKQDVLAGFQLDNAPKVSAMNATYLGTWRTNVDWNSTALIINTKYYYEQYREGIHLTPAYRRPLYSVFIYYKNNYTANDPLYVRTVHVMRGNKYELTNYTIVDHVNHVTDNNQYRPREGVLYNTLTDQYFPYGYAIAYEGGLVDDRGLYLTIQYQIEGEINQVSNMWNLTTNYTTVQVS